MTAALLVAALSAVLTQETDWLALPIPAVCTERARRDDPPALWDGRHVRLRQDDDARDASAAPALPLAVLRRALAESTRSTGLEIHPSSALLAVRGPEAAVATARRSIADLDRATRALDVRVSIWHVPAGSAPDADFGGAVAGLEPWRELTLGSGEAGMAGEREVRPFVAGFRVEVAHDSGVADPDLGRIVFGRTLHLWPERVERGRAVHVRGLLDVAALARVDSFDPGTPDLGVLEQPKVDALQLAFSGTAAVGSALRVDVRGSGLPDADGTWWIGVRTEPDPQDGAWRVADFAFLENPAPHPPLPTAGALLEPERSERPSPIGTPLGAFDALQQATLGLTGSAYPRVEAVPRLLVGPTDDPTWAEIDALAAAAESDRLRTHQLEITAGELAVRLPVSGAGLARVLHGTERTTLADYDVTLAPETWMPVPETARLFDGICVEGRATRADVSCRGWSAGSAEPVVVGRDASTLGRFQLTARREVRGRARVAPGSRTTLVAGGSATVAIGVAVAAP